MNPEDDDEITWEISGALWLGTKPSPCCDANATYYTIGHESGDPELDAMRIIDGAVMRLDKSAQERVLTWAIARARSVDNDR